MLPSGKTSHHASITLKAAPAGKIFKGASQRALHTSFGSQLSGLTKVEQRRKEQFDKSLQREVEAIEQVISHQSAQKKARDLEVPARINNYVEGLKQPSRVANVD